MSSVEWIPLDVALPEYRPPYNDRRRMLVARAGYGDVGIAYYKPRSKTWKFPSAAMAFVPTHWAPMPEAPK